MWNTGKCKHFIALWLFWSFWLDLTPVCLFSKQKSSNFKSFSSKVQAGDKNSFCLPDRAFSSLRGLYIIIIIIVPWTQALDRLAAPDTYANLNIFLYVLLEQLSHACDLFWFGFNTFWHLSFCKEKVFSSNLPYSCCLIAPASSQPFSRHSWLVIQICHLSIIIFFSNWHL